MRKSPDSTTATIWWLSWSDITDCNLSIVTSVGKQGTREADHALSLDRKWSDTSSTIVRVRAYFKQENCRRYESTFPSDLISYFHLFYFIETDKLWHVKTIYWTKLTSYLSLCLGPSLPELSRSDSMSSSCCEITNHNHFSITISQS